MFVLSFFKITNNTRVCSRHFLESDYRLSAPTGKALLRTSVVPSVFNWRTNTKQRRKVIRLVNR